MSEKAANNPDLIPLVSHLEFSRDSIVVLRGSWFSKKQLEDLRDAIQKTYKRRALVIGLPVGASIEMLDEEQMRKHGWVRAQS